MLPIKHRRLHRVISFQFSNRKIKYSCRTIRCCPWTGSCENCDKAQCCQRSRVLILVAWPYHKNTQTFPTWVCVLCLIHYSSWKWRWHIGRNSQNYFWNLWLKYAATQYNDVAMWASVIKLFKAKITQQTCSWPTSISKDKTVPMETSVRYKDCKQKHRLAFWIREHSKAHISTGGANVRDSWIGRCG